MSRIIWTLSPSFVRCSLVWFKFCNNYGGERSHCSRDVKKLTKNCIYTRKCKNMSKLMFTCKIKIKQVQEDMCCEKLSVNDEFDYLPLTEEQINRKLKRNGRMCSITESASIQKQKWNVFVEYILTYYKAAFRANHVPSSVVLHQYGIRVIGTLNSGKGQSISATEAKQQLSDQIAQKAWKRWETDRKI